MLKFKVLKNFWGYSFYTFRAWRNAKNLATFNAVPVRHNVFVLVVAIIALNLYREKIIAH